MKVLKRSKVLTKIAETTGSNYTVEFKKKNGEVREMLCRQGVEYNLKGGTNKVVKSSNDYVSTFDVDKFAYRTINIATMTRLMVNGEVYKVVD